MVLRAKAVFKTYQSHCWWYNYFSAGGGVWLSPWSILNVRLEKINIKHTLTVQPCSLWCCDKGGILQWILETGEQLAQAALARKAGGRLIYKFRQADRALVPGVSMLLPLPVVWSRMCTAEPCSQEGKRLQNSVMLTVDLLMFKSISSLVWLPGSFALLPHLPHLLSGDRDGGHGGL